MNPRTHLTKILAGVILIGLTLFMLTACGGTATSDTSTSGAPSGDPLAACREAADVEPRPVSKVPLTAVLVSQADHSVVRTDPRSASYEKVLAAALTEQSRLLVDVVGQGVGDAHLAVDARLMPDGVNDLQRTQNLCQAQESARAGLANLLTSPSSGPLDVLGALQVLQGHLTGLEQSRIDVVLLGDLVNAINPVDLQDPAALAAPGVAVDRAAASGLLPDCSGWRVYAVGGSPDGATSEQDVQLREFWRTFFDRCGGALVVWDQTLTQFPVTTGALDPLPPITETAEVTTVTLPEPMTFDSGSADLLPDADTVLNKVLEILRAHPDSTVEITGHTDDVGDAANNEALGQRRAQAVADWLIRHGIDQMLLDVDTAGEEDPAVPGTDDQARAANRRVVLVIHHGA